MANVRTFSPKKSEIERGWRVIDAEGETLGRLATRIAAILRGKDKPTYTMHMSVGDNVIVINAEKVRVTGQKEDQKTYYRHTQYPGGLRAVTLSTLREKHPERIIQNAVKGMLPHNRLGRQNLRRLHVYAGPAHPHEAQVRAGQGVVGRRKQAELEAQIAAPEPVAVPEEAAPVVPPTRRRRRAATQETQDATPPEATTAEEQATEEEAPIVPPTRRRRRTAAQAAEETPSEATTEAQDTEEAAPAAPPTRRRRRTAAQAAEETPSESSAADNEDTVVENEQAPESDEVVETADTEDGAADENDESKEQG